MGHWSGEPAGFQMDSRGPGLRRDNQDQSTGAPASRAHARSFQHNPTRPLGHSPNLDLAQTVGWAERSGPVAACWGSRVTRTRLHVTAQHSRPGFCPRGRVNSCHKDCDHPLRS